MTFNVIGWVNSVCWSPDATILAYATHDCELNFVNTSSVSSKDKPDKVLYKGNPFIQGVFINATTYIGCGFDKVPFIFKKGPSGWAFAKHLDDGFTQEKQAAIAKGSFEQSQVFFKKSETVAANSLKLEDDVIMKEMNTKHSNYINYLKLKDAGKVLVTSDVNGYVNYWKVDAL